MSVAWYIPRQAVVILSVASVCWAARCTTVLNSQLLDEYAAYVASVEPAAERQFRGGELLFVPPLEREAAATRLDAGEAIEYNRDPVEVNDRLVEMNGSIFHYTGAIRIQDTTIEQLAAVLVDYAHCASIYGPLVYECETTPAHAAPPGSYKATHGYHYVYRFVRALHFSFRAESRIDHVISGSGADRLLRVHQAASEVRESISGEERSDDLFEPGRDRGILWDFDTYWRARAVGHDLYVEYDVITLGRSVRTFSCKIGFIPVPRAIIARVAERLPSETLKLMLTATKRECERRAGM